eukprot:gene8796-biopygen7650
MVRKRRCLSGQRPVRARYFRDALRTCRSALCSTAGAPRRIASRRVGQYTRCGRRDRRPPPPHPPRPSPRAPFPRAPTPPLPLPTVAVASSAYGGRARNGRAPQK